MGAAMPVISATELADTLRQRALARTAWRQQQMGGVLDPAALEQDWQLWLRTLFPRYVSAVDGTPIPFASRHAELWAWAWALERGVRPPPLVAIWPRGGAKSTSAELVISAINARDTRRYALYIGETQEQADDHVANIASMLESPQYGRAYPKAASRLLSKYGASRGWRRNRLRTGTGFTIDSIGLDTAARGAKMDEARPDLMVFDDIDGKLDSPATTAKKETTLTHTLLPAGAPDLAVLAIQNLVHPDSIFARLADGRAEYLADRIVSGPYPALDGLTYDQRDGRYVITAGTPTWAGQDVARCQDIVNDIGITAFLAECQHDVTAPAGGMFSHLTYQHCDWDDVPWGELVRVVVWVDPAVTNKDASDAHGIQADGLARNGTIYRLRSREERMTPLNAIKTAILWAVELHAECVGIETDQGGDTWESVYNEAWRELTRGWGDHTPIRIGTAKPQLRTAKAGAGHGPKAHRASQMLADYERGRFVHVRGTHQVLERALHRFPLTKPLDLCDCAYWTWWDLVRRAAIIAPPLGVGQRSKWLGG